MSMKNSFEKELLKKIFIDNLKSKKYGQRTLDDYTRVLGYFFSWLRDKRDINDIKEVRSKDVFDYSKYLSSAEKKLVINKNKHYSPRTIGNMLGVIKLFFNFLLKREKILLNPFDKLVSLIIETDF